MKLSIRRLVSMFAVVLIFGLLLTLIYNVVIYHAEVPFWDQWRFVEFLQKYYANQLTVEDFWAQHNEHRLFFPRLIFLALALLSDWTILYEKLFSITLAVGIFISFVVLIRRTISTHSAWIYPWLALVMASLIFSLRQVENWIWGWQIAIYLNVLCICWATILLTSPQLSLRHVVGAICLTIIASYSFANGLVFWGIGFLLLCFVNQITTQRSTLLAIWSFSAIVTIFSYMYGYEHPYHHPPMYPFWTNPVPVVHYMLTYLGSIFSGWISGPYSNNVVFSTIMGGIGSGLFLTGLIAAWRMRLEFNKLLPIMALAIYAMGTSASSALGRLGINGVSQALVSRYTTIGLLFWCATSLLLCFVLLAHQQRQQKQSPALVANGLLAFILVMSTIASVASQKDFKSIYIKHMAAIDVLKNPDTLKNQGQRIKAVFWNIDLGWQQTEFLKRHHLSFYRSKS